MIPHLVFTAFWLCKHCKRSVQYLGTKVCNVELTPDKYFPDDDLQGSSWMMRFPFFSLVPAWYLRLAACAPTLRLKPSILFPVIWVVLLFFFMMSGLCWVHPSYFAPPYGSFASLRSSCVETMFILLLLHLETFCDFFYFFIFFPFLLAEAIFPLLCCSFSLLFPFQLFVLLRKKKKSLFLVRSSVYLIHGVHCC